jgi:hypothetical protein
MLRQLVAVLGLIVDGPYSTPEPPVWLLQSRRSELTGARLI